MKVIIVKEQFFVIMLKDWKINHLMILFLAVNTINNKVMLLVIRGSKLVQPNNLVLYLELISCLSFILKTRCR